MPTIINGTSVRTKQDSSQASYAFTLKREDEKIDFSKSEREIYNQVRGLNSWPGAYCLFQGRVLKVWECMRTDNDYPGLFNGQITKIHKEGIGVKVSNGEIILTVVQPEGKGKMFATDFINGFQNKEDLIGKVLD